MNKYKFLKMLEKKLKDLKCQDINLHLDYYKKDIEKRYKNHEKQKDIIASYGDINKLCNNLITKKVNQKKIKSLFKNEKNIIIKKNKSSIIVGTILFILIFILTLLSAIIFISSAFCYLDGVRTLGLLFLSFFIMILNILILDMINKLFIHKEIDILAYVRIIIILIIFIVISGTCFAIKIFKVEYVNKISDKYNLTRVVETIKFSANKTYLSFNSNYKTAYAIKYSDELIDEMKIEVKYYDVIYDYNFKKEPGRVFISLLKPFRDKISFYIDNLKENKIYNIKELEQYTVTIFINEKDIDKIDTEKIL